MRSFVADHGEPVVLSGCGESEFGVAGENDPGGLERAAGARIKPMKRERTFGIAEVKLSAAAIGEIDEVKFAGFR